MQNRIWLIQAEFLLRPSGTEPLVRVMVEGVDAPKVQQLAQQIAEQTENSVSDCLGSSSLILGHTR